MTRLLLVTTLVSLSSFVLDAQAPPTARARVEANVVYGMYSGLALLMDVHYPAAPNGYGVVFVPGSGWHASLRYSARPLKDAARDPKGHGAFVQPLINAGYTVFVINHRAAPRFRHPAQVEDAQRAVRFIRHDATRFGVNSDRIGGFGYSSGAHVIAMVGVLDGAGDAADPDPVNQESARLQAVVAGATPSDLLSPVSTSSAPAVTSLLGILVPPWEGKGSEEYRTYQHASPVSHITADDPPLLLIHGDADEEVPFRQAELMMDAAKNAGAEVRLVRIPGGTHGDLQKPNAPDYLGEMVAWYDRHLRGAK
jgi:dipeptidyl aminopeptidase/acylaminoacyl peptidase